MKCAMFLQNHNRNICFHDHGSVLKLLQGCFVSALSRQTQKEVLQQELPLGVTLKRSSQAENFAKLTGKHLPQNLLLVKPHTWSRILPKGLHHKYFLFSKHYFCRTSVSVWVTVSAEGRFIITIHVESSNLEWMLNKNL